MITETAIPVTEKPTTDFTIDIPWSPLGHFQLHLYRVIQRLIENIYCAMPTESLEGLLTDYPFLHLYRAQLESMAIEPQLADFEERYAEHLPIRALQTSMAVSDQELDLLLAAGLLEEDIRFGALFANLQHPLTSRQPCLGMLDWLLMPLGGYPTSSWQAAESLAEFGLVELKQGDDSVRLEWTIKVPVVLWDALKGIRAPKPHPRIQRQAGSDFPSLDQLILPPDLAESAQQLPAINDALSRMNWQ